MRWSRVIELPILVLLLIPSFGVTLAADTINVWIEASYEPGDKVEVEGTTNVTEKVTIIITNSSGHEILSLKDDPDEDGEFSVSFTLDEDAAEGTYGVKATVGNIYNSTSFEVVAESDDGEEDEGAHVQSEGDNPCDEITTLDDLLCAIERAFRFIEKANETAEALQEDYDMTLFLEKVNGLNESLTYLYENANDDNLEASVEEFCDLRNEISQLSGLLNSITKNVKKEKAMWFTKHMMRLIEGLEENIPMLSESVESGEFASALKAHQRKLERLWLTLNTTISPDELERILEELEGVTEGVESGLDGLNGEGYTLKEMYKVQARIQVLNATVERMKERGKTMNRLEEMLGNAEQLMNQMKEQFGELTQEQLRSLIENASDSLGGVGRTIREMNKSNNGGNGKSQGKSGQ
ncbi:MAG: hypothetical protein ACETVY_03070 [Candidatus Bathyarchaeia archaeon]